MAGVPLFVVAVLAWFVAMCFLVLAALLAVRLLPRAGRYWLPWAALCMALVLMVPMCWRPLELALATGIYDLPQASLSLGASFLLMLTTAGLGGLFPKTPPKPEAQ